jgi:acyl carrier protein phosphodiesterase
VNYLAHLLLSEKANQSLLGGLLGDFVKNADIPQFSWDIQQGIRLHKQIDMYTDAHPKVLASKRLVELDRRRFSGILVDVFYDHFLAQHWQVYSDTSLKDFTAQVYQILLENQTILPEAIHQSIHTIIKNDILSSYREVDGIRIALVRISKRLTRQNNLAEGIQDLERNYEQFEQDFLNFFPDLIHFSETCF